MKNKPLLWFGNDLLLPNCRIEVWSLEVFIFKVSVWLETRLDEGGRFCPSIVFLRAVERECGLICL